MKSLSKIAAFVVLIASVAASCGKYEDGPKISLLPKSARLIGAWKIDEMYKDGVSQTVTADQKDDYIEFKKGGVLSVTIVSSGMTTTFSGTWSFTANKANLKIVYSGSVFGIPFTSDEEYTILRLTSSELWVEQLKAGSTYETHYITK